MGMGENGGTTGTGYAQSRGGAMEIVMIRLDDLMWTSAGALTTPGTREQLVPAAPPLPPSPLCA